jgi:MFS superfamily sulfate permease-like transporter
MEARSLPSQLVRRDYRRSWLRPDVLAGLTVAAMLVPQVMAYAQLGGLPPEAGFRAALVALPVYALLGTSRHLGIGPEPGTAILAASAAVVLADGDPDRYAALMAAIALLVGVIALVAGLVRLGIVADLLSKPVLVGYITGVGITLLTSQISAFTGVTIDADNPFARVGEFLTRLDEIDVATLVVGLSTLAVIMGFRWWRPTVPGVLIGLVLATAAVAVFEIDVPLVGEISAAFPSPGLPDVGWDDLRELLPAAAGVALIGYTDNILTARSIASQQGYAVDANRELVALGAVNAAGGLAGGFAMSSSASRSFVPATIGSKTQLVGVVAFVTVVVFLLVGRSALEQIPSAALAAVITCLAVIGIDLLVGVLVAIVLSVGVVIARAARPGDAILGEGAGLDGWVALEDERATTRPGLLVYRYDAPLFFANAEHFKDRVHVALDENPGDERTVVLDLEGVGTIDTTAVDHLGTLLDELGQRDIDIAIARANERVLGVLDRAGLLERIGPDRVFPTINAAVRDFDDRTEGRTGGPEDP